MPKKRTTTSKPMKTRATGTLSDLQGKPVSKTSSQKVRGGGINRIVVTDGKVRAE